MIDFPELGGPRYLDRPSQVFATAAAGEVPAVLRAAEAAARAGHWVGGFIAYEAAAAFGLAVHPPVVGIPLVWFAVYARIRPVILPSPERLPPLPSRFPVPEITPARYAQDLQAILAYIQAGDTYQVNHTFPARFPDAVDAASLFLRLYPAHRHPYSAWLQFDQGIAACFSPELFLDRQGERLTTAPIKGTRPRGQSAAEEHALGMAMESAAKDRAEHIMIVDMARNDLGRVCRTGTIRVPHLCERRVFPTVQHLETRVHGHLRAGIGLDQIMAALFPAASITGAPKHRTMEIIREWEQTPRGIYTGSLGLLRPGGDFTFNVAIRTLTSWHNDKSYGGPNQPKPILCIGLGGGIVADSNVEEEWREAAQKGRFLQTDPGPCQLIETFLLDERGDTPHVVQHLERLTRSARILGFPCDTRTIGEAIQQRAQQWHQQGLAPLAMRLLLAADGHWTIGNRPRPPVPQYLRVCLAPYSVDRMDPFLRHKTTRRSPFDTALSTARSRGYDDALFFNNLGRVTEGAIRGVMVCLQGQWYAPPIGDGRLPSIWQANAMQQLNGQERSLDLNALQQAEAIRMGNAVQGGAPVVRLDSSDGTPLANWQTT